MDELVKALQRFVVRDLAFILGGSAVLLAFLHVYGEWSREAAPPAYLLFLGAGLAYAVGLAVQETALRLGLVRTRAGAVLPPRVAKQYGQYDPRPPMTFEQAEYDQASDWLWRTGTPQRYRDNHERTESLKQVGTAMGPCFVLSGLILLIGLFSTYISSRVPFEWAVAMGLIVVGFALGFVGWMKVAQQARDLVGRFRARDRGGYSRPE